MERKGDKQMNKMTVVFFKALRRYFSKSFGNEAEDISRKYVQTVKERDYRKVKWEICYQNALNGMAPIEFYKFELYEKSKEEKEQFISLAELKREFVKNRRNHFPRDKYERYLLFKPFFKRSVVLISFNDMEKDEETYRTFCISNPHFIAKPVIGTKGHGVQMLYAQDAPTIEILHQQYPDGCMLEEVIEQGEELAVFHPQSINTVRVVTAMNDKGEFSVIHTLIRVGVGDAVVDNIGAGGDSGIN